MTNNLDLYDLWVQIFKKILGPPLFQNPRSAPVMHSKEAVFNTPLAKLLVCWKLLPTHA